MNSNNKRIKIPITCMLHQYSTGLLFSSRTVFIILYTGVLRAFHKYIKEKLKWKTRRRNWVLVAEISRPGSVTCPALNSSQSVYSTTAICNHLVLHNTNSVTRRMVDSLRPCPKDIIKLSLIYTENLHNNTNLEHASPPCLLSLENAFMDRERVII